MTRNRKSKAVRPDASIWSLQDAKARFSELVRKTRDEGPQLVTVHGREEVVVMTTGEFHRLRGDIGGETLVEALRSCPYRDWNFESAKAPMPVRDVEL